MNLQRPRLIVRIHQNRRNGTAAERDRHPMTPAKGSRFWEQSDWPTLAINAGLAILELTEELYGNGIAFSLIGQEITHDGVSIICKGMEYFHTGRTGQIRFQGGDPLRVLGTLVVKKGPDCNVLVGKTDAEKKEHITRIARSANEVFLLYKAAGLLLDLTINIPSESTCGLGDFHWHCPSLVSMA